MQPAWLLIEEGAFAADFLTWENAEDVVYF